MDPEVAGVAWKGAVRTAWAQWLTDGWSWDWFTTHTFAPPRAGGLHTVVGWGQSDGRFREWVDGLAKDGAEPYWFRAREPHQFSNATHFHALVGGVGNLSRRDAWRSWFERNGQARVDPIRSADDVALYVAKYVLKLDGSVDFSENAGRFTRGNTAGFWNP
jgi:hypothetical protein